MNTIFIFGVIFSAFGLLMPVVFFGSVAYIARQARKEKISSNSLLFGNKIIK